MRVRVKDVVSGLLILSLFWVVQTPVVGAPLSLGDALDGRFTDQAPLTELPIQLKPEEVEAFLAPLSDQQSRQLLIHYLRRVANEANSEPVEVADSSIADFLQGIQNRAVEIANATSIHHQALTELPGALNYIFLNLTDLRGASAMWQGLLVFAAMLLAGAVAVLIFSRLSAPWQRRLALDTDSSAMWRLLGAALHALVDFFKVSLFTVSAYGVSLVFFEQFDPMRYFTTTYLSVVTVVWLTGAVSRFLFSPDQGNSRLIDLSDTDARATHRWIVLFSAVASSVFFTNGLLAILGFKAELLRLYIIAGGGLCLGVLLTWIGWQHRRVSEAMLARISSASTGYRLRVALAQSWHILAGIYLFGLWWLWASNVILQWEQQALAAVYSLIVLFVVPFADYFFGVSMQLLLRNQSRDQAAQARMREFVQLLQRALRLVLIVVAAAALSGAWSHNLYVMVNTESGSVVFQSLLNIGSTLLLAFIAWEAVKIFIDPHIPAKPTGAILDAEDDGGGGGSTRSETLLPLFRSFICIVLLVSVTMIVLASLGVDIAPLLAGAGVIGLAVGFGAQKLVQDIISGIFFLVDDAFRIGEYVEAGTLRGMVESISLRSVKLRHHLGMVQTIPFGDISAIVNHSRDWIIMKLEFRMPYDTNIEKVRKLIKQIGQSMQKDPVFGGYMLQPLKSQGVLRIEESTLIMRMKFTSVPGQQWVMRREAYRRVQEAFRENGLEFAHRKVFVETAPGSVLSKSELAQAGAAIAEQENKAIKQSTDDR